MQSGHGNGRNNSNGYGRINHYGLSQQGVIKNHDPKSVSNGNMASLNSMASSEESRERERQEARAQREMVTRVHATPSPDTNEAMFAVVPRSPNASDPGNDLITMILGNFMEFTKTKNTQNYIGVDQQPPTPAPSSQIHDPDTYTLPPPLPPARASTSSHSQYSSHRSHHPNAPSGHPNRPRSQVPSPSVPSNTSNKQPSQFPLAEEMKRSHKSGPGPGGSGNRGPHQEKEFSNKPGPHTLNSRGRPPHLTERVNKDPQILKIMSEMNDLKAPVSALLKTPRPDHQSSFTFPPPSSSNLMHSFRVPMDPNSKGKQNERANLKQLDRRSIDECPLSEDSDDEVSPSSKSKKDEIFSKRSDPITSSICDDLLLSEDSELEAGNVSLQSDNGKISLSSSGLPLHSTSNRSTSSNILSMIDDNVPSEMPISPLKTTDESSNSEDSSGSDSESSSSDDGGKKSPPPSSPLQNDTNHWNLTNLFQPGNNVKAESPKPKEIASRNGSENLREPDQESSHHLPDHINEPAPPVVTTVPNSRMHKKLPEERHKTASLNSPTTDESSEEENSRPTPKVQRTACGRPSIRSNYNRSRHLPVAKNSTIVAPNLSSDSDDEPVTASKRLPVIPRPIISQSVPEKLSNPLLQSPRTDKGLPINVKHQSKNKKQDVKMKELHKVKSHEIIPSDSDSDHEVINSPHMKLLKDSSSLRARHNGKISEIPCSNHKSLVVTDIGRSPLPVKDQSSFQRQRPGDLPRVPERHRKISEVSSRASLTPRALETETMQPVALKREQSKRESREKYSQYKLEKKQRRKNKRPHEESVIPKKVENVVTKNEIPVEISRIKATVGASPIPQTCASPRKEQLGISASSSKYIKFENGVPKIYISIPRDCFNMIPSKKHTKSGVEEKVNKEVLERRTSGEGGGKVKHIKKSTNAESPSNEEETKLLAIKRRAICSIYNKKRPSSLEPDKAKLKVKIETEVLGTKSPSNVKAEDNHKHLKRELKMDIKEELKHPSLYSNPVESKCFGSSTSLSSMHMEGSVNSRHGKKHKKEKRKDKSKSRETSKELDTSKINSNRRKSLSCSESEEVAKKRCIRETAASYESFQGNPSHPLKKFKTASGQTPVTSPSLSHLSPHPRSSQRNTSEERPHSSMSSDHYPHSNQSYHNSRSKTTPLSSQLTPKGSAVVASPYLDRESDYEAPIGEDTSHMYQEFNARDKTVEETHIVPSGNTSEYQSMPSSEHEPRVSSGSTYRNIDDRVSPQPTLDHMVIPVHQETFSHVHNSVSNSTLEFPSQIISHKTTPGVPTQIYYSTFERVTRPIEKDHMLYLNKAKELKHAADRETQHRWLQAVEYLEAVLYFILTGESMESEPCAYAAALQMYTDTLKLIKHVSSPVFRRDSVTAEGNASKLNVILAVLSLRCQSLLSLKLYSMQKGEFKEVVRCCNEYIRVTLNGGRPLTGQASSTPSSGCAPSTSTGSATPSAVPSSGTWGGSQRSAANNSPSSLSPTPSPAGSVGSDGSQSSSGYSTESTRQQRGGGGPTQTLLGQMTPPTIQPNPDLSSVMKCFQVIQNLTQAQEMWVDADNTIHHNDEIKAFFIDIDQRVGPLTFNSSLRDLVPYINEAIYTLKKLPFPAPTL